MRLKCIKLAGFKSFVEPTTVNFPGNLSAVVGPNGCGKSNIIDAVRWVMGESSAKNLRGESMTDVIFNGSANRQPIGQASIELVFDNSAGTLGGEYAAFSEIAIKRRVTREAQNLYFLNGERCRRKDITDIFLGTGLGPRSYAIIEQGMISRLIESKPEELRVFIEEAAGISKYKERRKETESRMRRTSENLERLTDIREELGRQLTHLQKQAEAAAKYTELKAEERQRSAELKALEWQSLDQRYQAGQQAIQLLALDLEKVVTEQAQLEAEVEANLEEQTEKREYFNEIQSRFYQIGAEITKLEHIQQTHQEKKIRLEQDLLQHQQQLQDHESLLAEDESALAIAISRHDELLSECELLEEKVIELEEQQDDAEQVTQGVQVEWDELIQLSAEAQSAISLKKSAIHHAETILIKLNDRKQKQQIKRNQLDNDPVIAVDDDVIELELVSEQLLESELKQTSITDSQQALAGQIQAITEALDQIKQQHQQQQGKLSSLQTLQQEGQQDQFQALSAWLNQQTGKAVSALHQNLVVDSGWEDAVEHILGEALNAYEVPIDLIHSKDHHQLNQHGVYLFAAIDAKIDFAEHSLLHKIKAPAYLAPLLMHIYTAEDELQAKGLLTELAPSASVVTRQGLWLGHNWRKTPSQDKAQGILRRQVEIEQLIVNLADSQSKLQQKSAELADLQHQQQRLNQELQETQAKYKQYFDRKHQLDKALVQQEAKLGHQKEQRQLICQELEEIETHRLTEEAVIIETRAELGDLLEDFQQLEDKKQARVDAKQQAKNSVDEIKIKLTQTKQTLQQQVTECQRLREKMRGLEQQKQRIHDQVSSAYQRQQQIETELADLVEPDETHRIELAVLLDKRIHIENSLTEARSYVEIIDNQMRQLEQQRIMLAQKNEQVRSELEQARIAAQAIETEASSLQSALADYDLKTLLENMAKEANPTEWQRQLEKLSQRIKRLGAINLAAIEEYDIASERKTYLDQQDEDLQQALLTLENAIKKIDKETRAKFKATFDQINQGVQTLFPKVFGGGRAYLALTGDDLLNTGIAIMAQPPGKKNSTIHLLSGGEKALTAISLVFSIFQLNPAPFCMLDEVDAPLDDANVARYAKLVQQMSEQVQFIYITHNKIAMEMASHLLGVTMHEPGVSRMVTVDVEEAAELAAS